MDKADVIAAIDRLKADGIEPTYAHILRALGSGSRRDLSAIMNEIKADASATSEAAAVRAAADLMAPIAPLITALQELPALIAMWDYLRSNLREDFDVARRDLEQTRAQREALCIDIEAHKATRDHLQAECFALREELGHIRQNAMTDNHHG